MPNPAPKSRLIDLILCFSVVPILLVAVFLKLKHPDVFVRTFAQEDGPIENATLIALALTGIIYAWRSGAFWSHRRHAAYASLIAAAAFLWAAGEEISWGQRIFGWETNAFFAAHNKQGETNLHNLVIGGHHLARVVFGNILSLVLLAYFLLLPPAWLRMRRLRCWLDTRAIPVPASRHTALIVIASVVMVAMPNKDSIWEVFEWVFAQVSLALTLWPRNSEAIRFSHPEKLT